METEMEVDNFPPPSKASVQVQDNANVCDETQNDNSYVVGEAVETEGDDGDDQKKKRAKTSIVWVDFEEVTVQGVAKAKCKHCKKLLSVLSSKSTTHLKRHLETCLKRRVNESMQQKINFPSVDSSTQVGGRVSSAYTNGKFDMSKMREAMAEWILMDEHAFSVIETEGFNLMQKRGMPEWEKVSRVTIRKEIQKIYENEKKKLMMLLETVSKISLTTDLWKSTNQKIGYMVLTGHFVDSSWKLQKRVLSFVRIPPPHRGIEIAAEIFKCLKEWKIENKIYTISVDNASNNDVAVRNLKSTCSRSTKLLCGGKLFHVRCCAHILNLLVQDGISEIRHIIENVRESVHYINQSEQRLIIFSEIVQQLKLPHKKLILDCKTRWNSTFDMLSVAIKFKEAFEQYKEREGDNFTFCPSSEDWRKVEKVCEVLGPFSDATNIISGSDYPTSNLFLTEVLVIKEILDAKAKDVDEFICSMAKKMKAKFDKYWGECNLLMSIAAVLDPRCKNTVIDYAFPTLYSEGEARENIRKVNDALKELYSEYLEEHQKEVGSTQTTEDGSIKDVCNESGHASSGWARYYNYAKAQENVPAAKSDLTRYLEAGIYIHVGDPSTFDVLAWWKSESSTYRILSKMARDILAIPITTVASEATFSAGSRVIDSYCSSLSPETVQEVLCGGDWTRNFYGVKKRNKKEKKSKEIVLPIEDK